MQIQGKKATAYANKSRLFNAEVDKNNQKCIHFLMKWVSV
jgi:hypothetical protein